MTTNQSNQERMGSVVSDTLASNNAIWSSNLVFSGHVATHNANLQKVRLLRDKQMEQMDIIGITRDKNILRTFIIDQAIVIIGALRTLAHDINDNSIYSGVNFSESKLKTIKESIFLAACNQISTVAGTHSAALLPYSITAAMLNDFAADITSFQSLYSKTQSKKIIIKGYTADLAKAVKTMCSFLKKVIDNNIKQFKAANPDFVQAYFNSRKIINYGNTQTGIRGTITNVNTGQKLKSIQVTIVELGMVAYSSVRGVYYFGKVPFGKYTLRMRGKNYITTEIPGVQLHDGKLMDYDITLMPDVPVPTPVPVNA